MFFSDPWYLLEISMGAHFRLPKAAMFQKKRKKNENGKISNKIQLNLTKSASMHVKSFQINICEAKTKDC